MAQPLQHGVALAPRAHGDQRRRFAQAVADRRGRSQAKACGEVSHHRTERNLSADQPTMIGQHVLRERAVPELIHTHLTGEALVLAVLCAQYFRPLARQAQPHVVELIAGTREHKSDAARMV